MSIKFWAKTPKDQAAPAAESSETRIANTNARREIDSRPRQRDQYLSTGGTRDALSRATPPIR